MKIVIKKDIEENGSIIGAVTTSALLWKKGNNINYIVNDFREIVEKLTEKDFYFLEKGNIIFWDDYTIKGIMQPQT